MSPDFERQCVVASDEEEADRDFVHGESEDEKCRSDDGEFEVGNRDAPEGLPVSRSQVEGCFFLSAVELLQSREYFGGGDGDEGRAMSEDDRKETEFDVGDAKEHEKRESGDDSGKDEREKYEATKESFAGELRAVEGEGGGDPEGQGDEHGRGRDEQAVEDGIPDGSVVEEDAIPVEREVVGREAADALSVEGIENEDDDGQIEEGEDEERVEGEEARGASHWKLHFFSRRSEKTNKDRTSASMPREMAAPRGQL